MSFFVKIGPSNVLLLLTLLSLAGCGGGGGKRNAEINPANLQNYNINGEVELTDSQGSHYSFRGATVKIYGVEESYFPRGKSAGVQGSGLVNNGVITIPVKESDIVDEEFYTVEVSCPADVDDDLCTVNMPLHVVLKGKRLKQGGWVASLLTEVAYKKLEYFVRSQFSVSELERLLDAMTGMLLKFSLVEVGDLKYEALLNWRPDSSVAFEQLMQPDLLLSLSESIASGLDSFEYSDLIETFVDAVYNENTWSTVLGNNAKIITYKNNKIYLSLIVEGKKILRVLDVSEIRPTSIFEADGDFYAVSDNGVFVASASTIYWYQEGSLNEFSLGSSLDLTGDIKAISVLNGKLFVLKESVLPDQLELVVFSIEEFKNNQPLATLSWRFAGDIKALFVDDFNLYVASNSMLDVFAYNGNDALEFVQSQRLDNNFNHLRIIGGCIALDIDNSVEVYQLDEKGRLAGRTEKLSSVENISLSSIDDYLYIAMDNDLVVYQVNAVCAMEKVHRFKSWGNALELSLSDRYIFSLKKAKNSFEHVEEEVLAFNRIGVSYINLDASISTISLDLQVGGFTTPYPTPPLWLDDRLFLPGFKESSLIDVENIDAPRKVELKHNLSSLQFVADKDGQFIYSVDKNNGLRVYKTLDYQDSEGVQIDSGSGLSLSVYGDLLYVGMSNSMVVVYDISDPGKPREITRFDVLSMPYSIESFEDKIYVFGWSNGVAMEVYDIGNLDDVSRLATKSLSSTRLNPLQLEFNERWLAATVVSRVCLFDLRGDVEADAVACIKQFTYAIALDGNILYMEDFIGNIRAVDIKDPMEPRVLGVINGVGHRSQLTVVGGRLYVTSLTGLRVYPLIKLDD